MKCRHCGSELSLPFLDLATAPPSNAYLDAAQLQAPETWYPLRLLACEQCWLVQTEDYAGREALFAADYAYYSSTSTSWLVHARSYVDMAVQRFALGAQSMVAEIAANDGYLLQYVLERGIPCYGVEPTAGTAAAARARGITIFERFFGKGCAEELRAQQRQADLIIANNVLAHVPDINDFVGAFAVLLKPGGVASFEFPHLLRMVQGSQFDTAYHEHFSYLSLLVVDTILSHNGLNIFDVEELPTHGGSLRVYAQRSDNRRARVREASVDALLQEEARAGLRERPFYAGLQRQAERIKDDLLSYLIDARRQGLRVAAYGAAAKGNTLLNFAGVHGDLLACVADRSPGKQGRYLPGSRIPIVAPERMLAGRPDRILILPWNIRSEVMGELALAREWGARFVTAVPRLEES